MIIHYEKYIKKSNTSPCKTLGNLYEMTYIVNHAFYKHDKKQGIVGSSYYLSE